MYPVWYDMNATEKRKTIQLLAHTDRIVAAINSGDTEEARDLLYSIALDDDPWLMHLLFCSLQDFIQHSVSRS